MHQIHSLALFLIPLYPVIPSRESFHAVSHVIAFINSRTKPAEEQDHRMHRIHSFLLSLIGSYPVILSKESFHAVSHVIAFINSRTKPAEEIEAKREIGLGLSHEK